MPSENPKGEFICYDHATRESREGQEDVNPTDGGAATTGGGAMAEAAEALDALAVAMGASEQSPSVLGTCRVDVCSLLARSPSSLFCGVHQSLESTNGGDVSPAIFPSATLPALELLMSLMLGEGAVVTSAILDVKERALGPGRLKEYTFTVKAHRP